MVEVEVDCLMKCTSSTPIDKTLAVIQLLVVFSDSANVCVGSIRLFVRGRFAASPSTMMAAVYLGRRYGSVAIVPTVPFVPTLNCSVASEISCLSSSRPVPTNQKL
jgi:hypothetical protein